MCMDVGTKKYDVRFEEILTESFVHRFRHAPKKNRHDAPESTSDAAQPVKSRIWPLLIS